MGENRYDSKMIELKICLASLKIENFGECRSCKFQIKEREEIRRGVLEVGQSWKMQKELSILLQSTVKLQDPFPCTFSPLNTSSFDSHLFYSTEFGNSQSFFHFSNSILSPLFHERCGWNLPIQAEIVRNWICEIDWYPGTEKKTASINSVTFGCRWSLDGFIQVMSNPNMYCVLPFSVPLTTRTLFYLRYQWILN